MSMITQVEPVTQLQRNYQVVLDKLDAGPVILSNRGKAAAVVMSVEDYDQLRGKAAMYERQVDGDLAVRANDWVSDDEVTETFTRAGVQ